MATARDDRHREQEFYRYSTSEEFPAVCPTPFPDTPRYYHPFALRYASPDKVDLLKPDPHHVAHNSPDTALNAFCQLGALRLAARRCMIFSFDTQNAFVLAETTRTLSLRDDTVHDEHDGLWLGYSVLPRGLCICEHTVRASISQATDHAQATADMVFIVNDLREDERFSNRPYVLGGPKARFYAGIPLVTRKGVPIGALCILDDTPRDGLPETEVNFLCQMSRTVMEHLEIVRSRMEFSQGTQMLTSLDKFFKATDESEMPHLEQETGDLNEIGPPIGLATPSPLMPSQSQEENSHTTPRTVPRTQLSPETSIDEELQHTFRNAAQLVRDAADADGVLFLGPTAPRNVSGATGSQSADGDTTSPTRDFTSTGGETSTDSEEGSDHSGKCTILGYSVRSGNKTALKPLSSRMLKALLHRYPKGKVWLFNAAGEASSDTQDSNSDSSHKASGPPLVAAPSNRKPTAAAGASKLQAWLPGVRSLCLVTLWDQVRMVAYAGCLVWSNEPSRVFSPKAELSYVRAFCEVVSSKVSRLETTRLDAMKTQFISSVSHELRSPLHGIIGSVDLLQEQGVMDWKIIDQIEKCTTSLMDVIDHLLDWAKVNNLVAKGNMEKSALSKPFSKARKRQFEYSRATEVTQEKVQSISQVTAEIVDVVYYSHCHTADAQQLDRVDFILDVSTDPALDYTPRISPWIGSWKRVCMNLTSNALKYTSDGHILVSLKIVQGTRKIPTAVFTVKDTGCGMARDFLETRLFRAFTQEDSLSAGTGLGMNLVAKLIKGLGGRIEVNSIQYTGTMVKVTIPLDVQTHSVSETPTTAPLDALRVRVLESPSASTLPDSKNIPRQLHLTALQKTLRHLGANVTSDIGDFDVIWEGDLPHHSQSSQSSEELATKVIVLCDTFMSAANLRKQNHYRQWKRNIEFVARPYGPEEILIGIKKCLALESAAPPSSNHPSLRVNVQPMNDSLSMDQRNDTQACSTPTTDNHGEVVEKSRRAAQMRLHELAGDEHLSPSEESRSEESRQRHSPTNDFGIAGLSLASPGFSSAQLEASINSTFTGDDSGARQLSLLLVDDNRINVRLLTTYADRNGHPWLSASNGAEAVQAYKSSQEGGITYNNCNLPRNTSNATPEVVFMDINMPVVDGFEATLLIREFEKAQGLRRATVVALTGLGSDDAREAASASGIDIFLTKPVRPRELKKLLEEIGERRSTESGGPVPVKDA